MKRILIALLSLVLILIPILASAQQRGLIISGKVTDEEGNPLPGTNVTIKEYKLGASSDENGVYRFIVPARFMSGQEVELTAEFIGYHTGKEKIVLSPGTITKDFSLKQDVLEMDAVVVTGVTKSTPKKLLPFTVKRVAEEDIQMDPKENPIENLQGKVAGVSVVKGSGRPGSGLDIRLRGSTNIGTGNSPLVIVDGVILNASQVDIDGLDVESMELVKGPAAAALYGSRAATGVINIKTKRGSFLAQGQTRIILRNEYGFELPHFKPYRNESHQYKVDPTGTYFVNTNGDSCGIEDPNLALDDLDPSGEGLPVERTFIDKKYPSSIKTYDHLKQFYRPGQYFRNTVTLSRNMPGSNFRLSISNLKEPGIMKYLKGYGRQNVRINIDNKLRDDLSLNVGAYFMTSWRHSPFGDSGPLYDFFFMAPYTNLEAEDENGELLIAPDPRSNQENPLYPAKYLKDRDYRRRLMGNFNLLYSPTNWFNAEISFGYDRSSTFNWTYYKIGYKTMLSDPTNFGGYYRNHSFTEGLNGDFTVSFLKSFKDLSTKTDLHIHYEESQYQYTYAGGDSLIVAGVEDLSNVNPDMRYVNSTQTEVRAIGYYASTHLDYKEKYIGSLLLRYDGSSLFGEDERYHLYYRGSVAWRVSEEPFWFTDKINEFKLRASYGTAGSRPGFYDQYETFNVGGGAISKGRLGNSKLKPAFARELEVGVEMAFLDRFSFEITYSTKDTKDQILTVPLAGYMGYSNEVANAGDLKSSTIEAELQAFVIQKRDMSWSIGANFSRIREEITKLDRPPWRGGALDAFYFKEGEVHGRMYGHRWITKYSELPENYNKDAFDKNDDGYLVPVGEGNTWKDGLNSDGTIKYWGTDVVVGKDADGNDIELDWGMPIKYVDDEGSDFVVIGNVIPDFTVGLTSNFRWKGLSIYMVIDSQIGGDIYNETRQWTYREYRWETHDQRGKKYYEKKPMAYYDILYDTNDVNSEFVENGTYVKLRELSINYRFDKKALSGFAGGIFGNIFHAITFGVRGRNLITLTKYSGFDPEVGNVEQRVDNYVYPHFRQITGVVEIEL